MSDLDAFRQAAREEAQDWAAGRALQAGDPIPAAVARLRSPAVTTGATPIPPELAGALADLLEDLEDVPAYEATGEAERVARAVLGWL